MARYALLVLPSANRVYANASAGLARAELEMFNRSVLGGRLSRPGQTTIGGVPCVTFGADRFGRRDAAFLANLSGAYALFEVEGELLRPVGLDRLDRYDDGLITIQKYQGKTNEQFTKLLLNVTLMSSVFAGEMLDRKFAVIDPLCGRGTTLNQALMFGFDAAGIESGKKDFAAYSGFIQTWLKRKRIKHHAECVPVPRDKRVVARRLRVSVAASKEDYSAGTAQRLDVVCADTTAAWSSSGRRRSTCWWQTRPTASSTAA